jgi:hypothetical protein
MNERIRELLEQAGMVKILEEHAHEYGNGMFENTPYPELEKFAQLIVNECCEQLLKEDIRYDGYGYNQYGLHDKLREHFGVKK